MWLKTILPNEGRLVILYSLEWQFPKKQYLNSEFPKVLDSLRYRRRRYFLAGNTRSICVCGDSMYCPTTAARSNTPAEVVPVFRRTRKISRSTTRQIASFVKELQLNQWNIVLYVLRPWLTQLSRNNRHYGTVRTGRGPTRYRQECRNSMCRPDDTLGSRLRDATWKLQNKTPGKLIRKDNKAGVQIGDLSFLFRSVEIEIVITLLTTHVQLLHKLILLNTLITCRCVLIILKERGVSWKSILCVIQMILDNDLGLGLRAAVLMIKIFLFQAILQKL